MFNEAGIPLTIKYPGFLHLWLLAFVPAKPIPILRSPFLHSNFLQICYLCTPFSISLEIGLGLEFVFSKNSHNTFSRRNENKGANTCSNYGGEASRFCPSGPKVKVNINGQTVYEALLEKVKKIGSEKVILVTWGLSEFCGQLAGK